MKLKKPTFDLLLKTITMGILMILSIIGIVFGSIRVADNTNRGTSYDGSVSTTVYFSPYESANGSINFSKPRAETDKNIKPIADIDGMLQSVSKVYAERLYAQGFSQVTISQNASDPTASKFDGSGYFDKSWMLEGTSLPSVTVTVNKLNPQNREERFYTQKVLRQTLFEVSRNFDWSLETTDGYRILDSNSAEFVKDSVSATKPSGTSSDSSVTFELKLSSSDVNSKDNAAMNYIDNRTRELNPKGDYWLGDGQLSVEGENTGLFSNGANGTTLTGNRNIVLWKDKKAALFYVRYIFNIQKDSNEYFSLSSTEQALWKFLHRESPYDDGATKTNLVKKFDNANQITLENLYYIYAVPKAYKPTTSTRTTTRETQQEEEAPAEIASPADTRSSRGGSTDFSSLFSPYILYEARTANADETQNVTLSNMFPKDQQFHYGGNAKVVLSEVLSDSGSYNKLSYLQANRLVQLIKNGDFANNVAVLAGSSVDNKPIMVETLQSIDAFGTSALALGIFLFLVGIIISVLYKIPGLLSFIPILLSGVLSLLLYTVFGGSLDLFTFLGLFAITSMGIGCLLLINETIRRNIRNSTSLTEASRLAYKQTFMKVVDIHLITLVLGLFLMYLGKYQESSFGILLIVGSFNSFFVTYGLSTALCKLFNSLTNWTNYRWFVYKRDSLWLNQISGQLDVSNERTTFDLVPGGSSESEMNNVLKQSYDFSFYDKKMLWSLSAWIIAVIVGIVSLVLFGLNIAWPISATVQASGLNIFISCAGTMGIAAAYLAMRYRWIVIVPYLTVSIVHFFSVLGVILIMNGTLSSAIQFENIFVLLLNWILGQVAILFAISWSFNYWHSYVIYKRYSLTRLLNDNMMSSLRLFALNSVFFPLGLLVFIAFNFGGEGLALTASLNVFLFSLFGIVVLGNVLVNFAVWSLFNVLLGLFVQVRQTRMQNHTHHAKAKERQNYDRIDEQLIPGINQRFSERHVN